MHAPVHCEFRVAVVLPYLPAGQSPLQVLLVAPAEVLKDPGGQAVHVSVPVVIGKVITLVQKQDVPCTPLFPQEISPGVEDLEGPEEEQYPEAV